MSLKHYTQRTLGSNLKNLWLQAKAKYRYLTDAPIGGSVKPPQEYAEVFSDDFKTVDSSRWRWGHPWGNIHMEQLWRWWPKAGETPSPVAYPTHQGLALELRRYPKTYKAADLPAWQAKKAPESWTADWATALLSSRKAYQFGWFEAWIQLPTERAQWSAFWLQGLNAWPPEIDVFEAYTDADENDISIKPNIHWGPEGVGDWKLGKKDWGAPRIPIKSPNRRFVQYVCHWTKDFIRIYIDGHLVQECTIPAAVKQNAQHQYIILNNGCKDPAVKGVEPIESGMLVKSLKVYQHPDWID